MQNQKDLKFLSTKVMGLENNNKIIQKELSEIKDAIGSDDTTLKAVSSNKKEHGWIDVSYIFMIFAVHSFLTFSVRFIFHI
jgi:hypothetical protein